ncbi:hypothetical protein SAMN04488513_101105 [Pseudozobellia thermophila]|uniref:Uncharacterized protein n=1 Tax=Pseudozobellia thermophila TaxID=192903 RepID=A0A1M6ALX2_9FLAO|nr:hypothetical protein SAMN04488513_101105 [Pseudozobellia thermophila]
MYNTITQFLRPKKTIRPPSTGPTNGPPHIDTNDAKGNKMGKTLAHLPRNRLFTSVVARLK